PLGWNGLAVDDERGHVPGALDYVGVFLLLLSNDSRCGGPACDGYQGESAKEHGYSSECQKATMLLPLGTRVRSASIVARRGGELRVWLCHFRAPQATRSRCDDLPSLLTQLYHALFAAR